MDNQTLMDIVALTTPDHAMLEMFEANKRAFERGDGAAHYDVMRLIVQAIDNTYGIGSFDLYKDTGILPSKQ